MIRPAPSASPSTAPGTTPGASGSRPRRLTRVASLATAAAGLVLVAGCQTMSPSQTQVPYQPADGVALNVGPVQARDLLLVASAKGATGVLSGSLVNTGDETVTVSFSAAPTGDAAAPPATGATTQLSLAPREQKRITTVEIPAVAAAPGALTGIVMATSQGDGIATVPVLLPTDYYSTLTPTSTATTATTPTSTATTTGAATTAPAPSDTATTGATGEASPTTTAG